MIILSVDTAQKTGIAAFNLDTAVVNVYNITTNPVNLAEHLKVWNAGCAFFESIYGGRNYNTSAKLNGRRAYVMHTLDYAGIECFVVPNSSFHSGWEIKGKSKKVQLRSLLNDYLSVNFNDDITDALGIGLFGIAKLMGAYDLGSLGDVIEPNRKVERAMLLKLLDSFQVNRLNDVKHSPPFETEFISLKNDGKVLKR